MWLSQKGTWKLGIIQGNLVNNEKTAKLLECSIKLLAYFYDLNFQNFFWHQRQMKR